MRAGRWPTEPMRATRRCSCLVLEPDEKVVDLRALVTLPREEKESMARRSGLVMLVLAR